MDQDHLLTDEQLVELAKVQDDYIKQLSKHGRTEVLPNLFIVGVNQTGQRVCDSFDIPRLGKTNEQKRDFFSSFAARIVREDNVVPIAICLVTEGWMIAEDKQEDFEKSGKSYEEFMNEDEDKLKIIVLQTLSIDGKTCGALYEMRHRHDNTFVPILYGKNNFAVSTDEKDKSYLLSAFMQTVVDMLSQL